MARHREMHSTMERRDALCLPEDSLVVEYLNYQRIIDACACPAATRLELAGGRDFLVEEVRVHKSIQLCVPSRDYPLGSQDLHFAKSVSLLET